MFVDMMMLIFMVIGFLSFGVVFVLSILGMFTNFDLKSKRKCPTSNVTILPITDRECHELKKIA
ncbi:hypothetical protein SAMN02745116_00510 [Pilibacter termitis]|uniref:Uncharacterized protein n=2 Tax=Pilibacter termitis TaxID=263852 RepID=A0A1T4L2S1_9ENTE|nr:hypothetical protein SAMN02745116_00510 [Pilibacter termitis]